MQTNKNQPFGFTLIGNNKLSFLVELLKSVDGIKGEVCEVGVYKGGSAKLIYDNMSKNENLYLFDTFEGIPNKSEFDNVHIVGDFYDSPYDEIVNYFKDRVNVVIGKGDFPSETHHLIPAKSKFKFVHLDVDTYQSYTDSLLFFYKKMVVGGVMIFDDYGVSTCKGATLAVDEFFKNKLETPIEGEPTSYIVKG